MHLTTDLARRLRRRVPVLIAVLVVIGGAAGAVLATTGGHPARTAGPRAPVPSTRPALAADAGAVVPLLGGHRGANALAYAIEFLVLRHLVNQAGIILFMATLGIAYFLEGFGQTLWGSDIYKISLGLPTSPIFLWEGVFPGGILILGGANSAASRFCAGH